MVSFASLDEPHILVDPCAGDGAAISTLRRHWFEQPDRDATIYAVELERLRADDQRHHLSLDRTSTSDVSLHCDAFHLEINPQEGASLLFLNPPYDFDKVHGRLEHKFLERWTAALLPGDGILMFLVPFYALKVSARFVFRPKDCLEPV